MVNVRLAIGAEADIASGDEVRNAVDGLRSELFGTRVPPPLHPRVPASLAGSATGTGNVLWFQGPAKGRVWALEALVVTTTDDHTGVVTASSSIAAAAAGSAFLPAGAMLSGFDIEFATGAGPISGDATVTGLVGGTQTYKVTAGVAGGSSLSVKYPSPIPASADIVNPTVSVPAMVGGSAYTINVWGVMTVALYVGDPTNVGAGQILMPVQPMPTFYAFPRETVFVQPGDSVFAVVYGAASGQAISGNLHVIDRAIPGNESMRY